MNKYPYFLYPAITELKENPTPERARELRLFISANVGDTDALIRLLGSEEAFRLEKEIDEKRRESTDSIDSFIDKFGGGSVLPAELQILPEAEVGEEEEKEEIAAGNEESVENEGSVREDVPAEAAGEKGAKDYETAEEVLADAREMVKNHDYDGAISIMEAFYLNNPKKSIYFADQIRFLKKLRLNESKKSK